MEQKSSKKKQVLLIFLVLAVLLGACSVSVTFYVKNYVTEGVVDIAPVAAASKTEEPDKNGFADYLNNVLLAPASDSNSVKTNLNSSVSIDDIEFENDKANTDTVKYIVGSLSGKISESYPSHEGDFGDGFNLRPAVPLTADSITAFEIKQGEVNPDDEESADEANYYYFTVESQNLNSAAGGKVLNCLSDKDLKTALTKVTDSLSEMLDAESCEITPDGMKVEGKTNRLSDQLQNLSIYASYKVKLDVVFKNDYEVLGKGTLTFKLTVKEEYNYTWAGVDITEDIINLSHNEEDILPLSVNISDKATEKDYKISFASEDESIVSINENGDIKGLKLSEKPVKITATFVYLGKTYTDSCEVYVTVPVKRIKTQPDKIKLNKGETAQLTCDVFPEDATIKALEWHTEDESIAVVSENGMVTAVGNGTVKVYAVSLDGHFRSSCVVTVGEVK